MDKNITLLKDIMRNCSTHYTRLRRRFQLFNKITLKEEFVDYNRYQQNGVRTHFIGVRGVGLSFVETLTCRPPALGAVMGDLIGSTTHWAK